MMTVTTRCRRYSLRHPNLVQRNPGAIEAALFLMAFWGPPRLRSRDALASLAVSIDWAVLVNFAVWAGIALWVFNEFNGYALRDRKLPQLGSPVTFGVLFGLTLAVSATVSVSPWLTLYKSSQVILAVLFGFFWVLKFGAVDCLRRLVLSAAIVSGFIMILGVVMPSAVWVGDRLKGGVLGGAGSAATLLIVGLLAGARFRGRGLHAGLLALGGVLLALSQVRTGYVAVALCLVVLALRGPVSRRARRVILALASVAPFALLTEAWMAVGQYLVRDTYSIATLSDRTPLWQSMLLWVAANAPLFGMGYYSVRTITLAYNPGIGTAHSAYVEVAAGAGLLGSGALALLLTSVGLGLRRSLRETRGGARDTESSLAMGLLLSCLILGLTSEEMLTGGPPMLTFLMMPAVVEDLLSFQVPAMDHVAEGEGGS